MNHIEQIILKSKALLFDLDGTLADTMPIHNQAWIETLAKYNCMMTNEILLEYAGVPNHKTVEIFNRRFSWSLSPSDIAEQKEARVIQLLADVKPVQSVLEVVNRYHGKIPMAIVSGGSRELVEFILTKLGLLNQFSHLVTAESTNRGKPNPDPFLLAASKLKVHPTECLVFEDGQAGIQAARTAQMKIIFVDSNHHLSIFNP